MRGIPLNNAAINYWQATGFTNADVENAARELDDHLFIHFVSSPGRSLQYTLSPRTIKTQQGHYQSTIRFFSWLVKNLPRELPAASFLVLLHDGYNGSPTASAKRIPIFTFARDRASAHQAVLMPDTEFLDTNGYEEEKKLVTMHSNAVAWQRKRPELFWRGGANGAAYLHENWAQHPRIRLCIESKKINNKNIIDAGLTAINVPDPQMKKAIEAEGITAAPVPFEQFYNYKHLIDIDGEHCTWQSHFMKLACESTFLKVESNLLQWHYDLLKPWENYIPVAADLSDLREILAWLSANDEKCHEIAMAGQATASTIGVMDTVYRFGNDLREILLARRA